jgi:nitric oxide synthase oxygenase domain/subunit
MRVEECINPRKRDRSKSTLELQLEVHAGFDDDNVPILHADVTKLNSELVSWKDHTDEFDIIPIE